MDSFFFFLLFLQNTLASIFVFAYHEIIIHVNLTLYELSHELLFSFFSSNSDNFNLLYGSQADNKFHHYRIVWDGINSVQIFVDYVHHQTITGSQFVPTVDLQSGADKKGLQIILASWFPNAWAGSPEFSTCVAEISSVNITGTIA